MKIIFVVVALFLVVAAENESQKSLWDQVIKMEQIVLSVEYYGRKLNVWKEDGHERYFVTPLCVMIPSTIKCDSDEFSPSNHYVFTFVIQLWDTFAANTIQLALQQQKGVDVKIADIHALPMQNVRLSINRGETTPLIKLDNLWLTHLNQPNEIQMNFGVTNEEFCQNLTKQAKSDLGGFLSKIKLDFEFTMSTVQQEFRELIITGKTIAKNEFFADLKNNYSDPEGNVHLTSNDANKLARDIYRTVKFTENVTAKYIGSNEESDIIDRLLNVINGQEVLASDLSKNQWDSVFWDDVFTRPDITTEFFNQSLTYDSDKKHFKFNETKADEFHKEIDERYKGTYTNSVKGSGGFSFAGFKFGAGGGKSTGGNDEGYKRNVTDQKDIYAVSKDDFEEAVNEKDLTVKWTGTKFAMKDLKLQRINTKTLQSMDEIYFKRFVISNGETTQKLPILPAPSFSDDKAPVHYDMLEKKFEVLSATLKAEIAQINEKLVNLESGHGNTKSRLSTLIECSHAAGACTQLPIAQ